MLPYGLFVVLILRSFLAVPFHSADSPQQSKPGDVAALELAKEINLGSFCLTDIPAGDIKVKDSLVEADGTWWRVDIRVTPQSINKPVAYFFSKPRLPNKDGKVTQCSSDQAASILKGKVLTAAVEALFKPATDKDSSRWQVDPGNFDVDFGTAEARLSPVFGATVVATGSAAGTTVVKQRRLWVTNTRSQLFYNLSQNIQSGILEIATTDVTLSGVQLSLGAGVNASVDLSCPYVPGAADSRTKFAVDVANGNVRLFGGNCVKDGVDLPAGTWTMGPVSAAVQTAHAFRISVTGDWEHDRFDLSGVDMHADRFVYPGVLTVAPHAVTRIGQLEQLLEPGAQILQLESPRWKSLDTKGCDIAMIAGPGISGNGDVHLTELSTDALDLYLHIHAPVIPVFTDGAIINPADLELSVKGKPRTPDVSGKIVVDNLQFGSLNLSRVSYPIKFAMSDSQLQRRSFDFGWDVSTPVGQVNVGNPAARRVTITGQIKRALLKGSLSFDPDWKELKISIPKDGVSIAINVAASTGPLVLGSPVQFVQSSLSFSTSTGLTIAKSGSAGALDATAVGLVLAAPRMSFSDTEHGFLLQGPLKTEGAATIQFDLATGKPKLWDAHLHAEGMSAKSISTTEPANLSGMDFISPLVSLGMIDVQIQDGAGEVAGRDFTFTTSIVEHTGPPYWKVSLPLGQGLAVPKFKAVVGETTDGLDVIQATITQFSLTGNNADFRTVDGFALHGDNFAMSADEISETAITNGKLAIATGAIAVGGGTVSKVSYAKASFSGFAVTLDGPMNQVDGTGKIHLSGISVGAKDKLHVGDCPEQDQWKLTGAFDIDHAEFAILLRLGRISARVDVNDGHIHVENDGYSRCEWDKDYVFVEEKYAIFDVPCWDHGPSMCRVKTIIVPRIAATIHWVAELHSLQSSGSINHASLELGGASGVRLCFSQLTISPPIIVANYHPNIKSGGAVQNALRDLVRGVATIFESALGTIFADSLTITSWFNNLFSEICIQ